MVGSDAFNLITIGGISLTRLELVVYRACVYISLMTSGEFVRSYSLSVGQCCEEHQRGSCVLHILDSIFGLAELLTFGTLIYSDYYLNLIYINYCRC